MMIDLHSHILPGLDDGSDDWDQSLRMARMAVDDGITGVICTPHWSPSYPDNTRDAILPLVDEFRSRIKAEDIPLEIYPGCEMVIHFALPEKLESGELLSINDGRRFALVEMPHEYFPPNLDQLFWMLQVKGVTPILGHPERNWQVIKNRSVLPKWIEAGVLVQITAGSLVGYFGGEVRELCRDMLQRRLVHFVGTDCHSSSGKRSPQLSKARALASNLIGAEETEKIFVENPSRVVRGELPDVREPLEPPRKQSIIKRLFPFWRAVGGRS